MVLYLKSLGSDIRESFSEAGYLSWLLKENSHFPPARTGTKSSIDLREAGWSIGSHSPSEKAGCAKMGILPFLLASAAIPKIGSKWNCVCVRSWNYSCFPPPSMLLLPTYFSLHGVHVQSHKEAEHEHLSGAKYAQGTGCTSSHKFLHQCGKVTVTALILSV